MEIKKPSDLTNKKVIITIQTENEFHKIEAINVFGGAIPQYEKDRTFTIVRPFIVGETTPGMIMSYVSALVNHAVQLSIEIGIPKNIIKELSYLAVEEGLNGRKV